MMRRSLLAGTALILSMPLARAQYTLSQTRIYEQPDAQGLQSGDQIPLERYNALANGNHKTYSATPSEILNYLPNMPALSGAVAATDGVPLTRSGATYSASLPSVVGGAPVMPALGTTTQTVAAIAGRVMDVMAQGAACNTQARGSITATIASTSNVLTVGTSVFAAGDVGKTIAVPGAGASGAALVTTIAAYTSGTQVTLAANAATSLTNATISLSWGTSDTAAINTAASTLSAAGGGWLLLPRGNACGYSATINIPAGVYLKGYGHATSALLALAPNLTAVELTGSNSGVDGIEISAGAAGVNTSGAGITYANGVIQTLINDFIIQSPFIGIISPSGVVLNTIQNGYIYNPTPSTGEGIQVLGGNNTIITNVFTEGTQSAQPFCAIEIQSSGQVVLNNNQGLWTGNGMIVDPAGSQQVTWLFDNQSSYDTGTGSGIVVSPTTGGQVRGMYEIGTWTATMSGDGVLITQDGSSTVDDIHFVGHRSYNNGLYGVNVLNAARFFFVGGSICGNSTYSTGIYPGMNIGAAATFIGVHDSQIGACAGIGATQSYGIAAASGANYLNITGNNLYGNVDNPTNIVGPVSIAQIRDNTAIDDQDLNVAAASTVALPPNPVVTISGTGNIQNLTGGWQGRQLTIIATGAWTTVSGGNIQNLFTAVSGTTYTATYAGTVWYLK